MLILKIAYWLVATILALKIVANFLIPLALSKKAVVDHQTGETGGVSIMPIIDVLCLLVLLVLALFIKEGVLYTVKVTALVFGGAIGISFITAFIVAGFIGWARSR